MSKCRNVVAVSLVALLVGCAAPPFKSQMVGAGGVAPENQAGYPRPQITYALPRTHIKVEAKKVQPKDTDGKLLVDKNNDPLPPEWQITMAATNVPDPNHTYQVMYDGSGWADDVHKLTVSESLLLTTASGQSRDRRGDVIIELAKLPAAVLKKPLFDFKLRSGETQEEFSAVYDWDDLMQISKGSATGIAGAGHVSVVKGAETLQMGQRPKRCESSFCYRTLIPIVLEVYGVQQTILIADERSTRGIDIDRAALVESKTELTFREGVLTGVDINKPSTWLAVASLPLSLFKAVLSVPAEILKIRVDYDSQKEAAVKQQEALLKAEDSLRKYKEGLGVSDTGQPAPAVISPIGNATGG